MTARRHALEEYPVPHPGALIEKGVHCQCVQHPGPQAMSVHILGIGYAVGVVPAVTYDVDSEDVGDGCDVIGEGAGRKLPPFVIDRAPHPQFLYLRQCQWTAALKCLQKPDVRFEIIRCHNECKERVIFGKIVAEANQKSISVKSLLGPPPSGNSPCHTMPGAQFFSLFRKNDTEKLLVIRNNIIFVKF